MGRLSRTISVPLSTAYAGWLLEGLRQFASSQLESTEIGSKDRITTLRFLDFLQRQQASLRTLGMDCEIQSTELLPGFAIQVRLRPTQRRISPATAPKSSRTKMTQLSLQSLEDAPRNSR